MAKKRRKKKKIHIPRLPLLILLVIGAIGFYITGELRGSLISIVAFIAFILLWKINNKVRRYRKLKRTRIDEIDTMSGEEFEQFLGAFFKRRGYKVSYTAQSGDYGADLILKDGRETIVVQAKRYSGTVGVKAVQEIIGAVRMYEASEAWVVTNNYFTKQAVNLADMNEVYLIDRDQLIDLLLEK